MPLIQVYRLVSKLKRPGAPHTASMDTILVKLNDIISNDVLLIINCRNRKLSRYFIGNSIYYLRTASASTVIVQNLKISKSRNEQPLSEIVTSDETLIYLFEPELHTPIPRQLEPVYCSSQT